MAKQTIRLDVAVDDDGDVELLLGALLAARGAERAESQRRDRRLLMGYGTESARDSMSAEVRQASRRGELLQQLIDALERGR